MTWVPSPNGAHIPPAFRAGAAPIGAPRLVVTSDALPIVAEAPGSTLFGPLDGVQGVEARAGVAFTACKILFLEFCLALCFCHLYPVSYPILGWPFFRRASATAGPRMVSIPVADLVGGG